MRRLLLALPVLLSCASLSSTAIDQKYEMRVAAIRDQWVAQHSAEMTPEVATAIRQGRVTIGMTVEQAAMASALYAPASVHRTTTAAGTREQYVFERRMPGTLYHVYRYVYVEGGRVVAVQD